MNRKHIGNPTGGFKVALNYWERALCNNGHRFPVHNDPGNNELMILKGQHCFCGKEVYMRGDENDKKVMCLGCLRTFDPDDMPDDGDLCYDCKEKAIEENQ